jgi:beta-galactosidase
LSSENVTFNSANKELPLHAYIVDEFGTIVPDADDKIEFEVEEMLQKLWRQTMAIRRI